MRTIFLLLLVCLALNACKKEEVIQVTTKPSRSIQLKVDEIINDSTIVLKWDKYSGKDFKEYRLFRYAKSLKNGMFTFLYEEVKRFSSADSLVYRETQMPFAKDITYNIGVIVDSIRQSFSSSVSYKRKHTIFYGSYSDAIINKEKKLLYLLNMEGGEILVVDYANNLEVTSKKLDVGFGFSSLGDFEGVNNELYVPTNDGWLLILDAASLELKDKIYVMGETVTSVIALKGKLYVSSSDLTQPDRLDKNAIKVYDRRSKNLIGRTGFWDRTRLLYLENSDIEMIDVTTNIIPVDLSYFRFSAAGIPEIKREDTYHGDYQLSASILRSFPDGSRFITASNGTIYTKDLVFEKAIKPYYNQYTDFAFNNDGSIIYCADRQRQTIEAISYPGLNLLRTYTTSLQPLKIFRDENTLISVSTEQINGYSPSYLVIDKINL